MTEAEKIQDLEFKLTDLKIKYDRLVLAIKETEQARKDSNAKPHFMSLKQNKWIKEKELNELINPTVKQSHFEFIAK